MPFLSCCCRREKPMIYNFVALDRECFEWLQTMTLEGGCSAP